MADRFELLAEHVPVGIFLADPDGLCTYVNAGWQRFVGKPAEAVIGTRWTESVHPDDRELVNSVWSTAVVTGTPFQLEFRLVRPDGQSTWVLGQTATERDHAGAISGYVGTTTDITERKQAEDARRLSETELQAVNDRLLRLHRLTEALAVTMTREQVAEVTTIHLMNAAGARAGMLGLLATPTGPLRPLVAPGYDSESAARLYPIPLDGSTPLSVAVQTESPIWIESLNALRSQFPQLVGRLVRPDNSAWANLPLVVDGHAIGGLALAFATSRAFDAAERDFLEIVARQCAQALERARLYEEELRARQVAEEAVRARDQFLSIAAHELRTPMTGIKGYAQLLARSLRRDDIDPERIERFAQQIVKSTDRLTSLVSDLLDVSRIRTGRLELRRQRLDLVPLVKRVIDDVTRTIDHDRYVVEVQLPGEPILVEADGLRTEQVIVNLVENAVKYSPLGGRIEVRLRSRTDGGEIEIHDCGMGFPAGSADRIFEPFGRAPNAQRSQVPGMGLGLYICKQIVEAHGGTISAESPGEGNGSIFRVRFPG